MGDEAEQVLTVRFALQPFILYTKFFILPNPFFYAKINVVDSLNRNSLDSRGYIELSFLDYFKIGVFFILALLHFLFYFRYKLPIPNLYFGVYCSLVIVILAMQTIMFHFVHDVFLRIWLIVIYTLIYFITALLEAKSIYILFSKKNGPIYWLLIVYFVVNFYLILSDVPIAGTLCIFFAICTSLEEIRVSIKANKLKKPGARIVLFGGIGYALFTTLFFIIDATLQKTFFTIVLRELAYNLGLISIPISFTFHYANEFARTSQSLTHRLEEVESLSTQNLDIKNQLLEQVKKELDLQKQMYEERERISKDLHDDIGSSLSSISILSATFMEQGKTSLEKSNMKNLGEQARLALDGISDIIWAVNPENNSVERVLPRMTTYAAEMLENIGMNLSTAIDNAVLDLDLPVELRKDFYLLFKEAINNIAKYSSATQVWIKLNKIGQEIILEIKDNGQGFELGKEKQGNGLKNMASRAKRMNGQLIIETAIGQGTLIKLSFPIT